MVEIAREDINGGSSERRLKRVIRKYQIGDERDSCRGKTKLSRVNLRGEKFEKKSETKRSCSEGNWWILSRRTRDWIGIQQEYGKKMKIAMQKSLDASDWEGVVEEEKRESRRSE